MPRICIGCLCYTYYLLLFGIGENCVITVEWGWRGVVECFDLVADSVDKTVISNFDAVCISLTLFP